MRSYVHFLFRWDSQLALLTLIIPRSTPANALKKDPAPLENKAYSLSFQKPDLPYPLLTQTQIQPF